MGHTRQGSLVPDLQKSSICLKKSPQTLSFSFHGAPSPTLLSLSLILMRVLFAVFVLSLAALIWTLLALRRHIRDHDAQSSKPLNLTGVQSEDSLKND